MDIQELNRQFCKLRNVRKTLWKQSNLQTFHKHLKTKGTLLLDVGTNKDDSTTADADALRIIDDVSSSSSDEEEL